MYTCDTTEVLNHKVVNTYYSPGFIGSMINPKEFLRNILNIPRTETFDFLSTEHIEPNGPLWSEEFIEENDAEMVLKKLNDDDTENPWNLLVDAVFKFRKWVGQLY